MASSYFMMFLYKIELDFYSVISLKQQSMMEMLLHSWHIIWILSQLDFVLTR
jgi:hypothetical protein